MVGTYTDRYPKPFSLPVGISFTLVGLLLLSIASSFHATLIATGIVGMGSSIFHPESSRLARLASGGRYGMAQSMFQVGGNVGYAAGPLLIAFIVLPRGQSSIAWFSILALAAIMILVPVSLWYRATSSPTKAGPMRPPASPVSSRKVHLSIAILVALIFSKYFYLSSINNYLIFYLMGKFGLFPFCTPLRFFTFSSLWTAVSPWAHSLAAPWATASAANT